MQLKDKTIVLTGATGGIGNALAVALANAGAHLILVGRDQQKLELLRSSLAPGFRSHIIFIADLTEAKSRALLATQCRQQGIDILINNAGNSHFGLLRETADSTITEMLMMNLEVPILLTKALLPELIKTDSGLVVNIGSAFGSIGYPGFSIYCGTKFGLRGFSEALRRELADTGVNVLHISPRSTQTPLNSSAVVAMNKELGTAMDTPEFVAASIVNRMQKEKWASCVLGWPEKFYALVNGLLPQLTDNVIRQNLDKIKGHAMAGKPNKTDVM